jgi:AcrR family transcriptional regulator
MTLKTGRNRGKAPRSQVQRSAASRERILDATVRLVGDRGVDGLRLADLGSSDKSLAVIYFGTKEGLLLAVADRLLTEPLSQARDGLRGLLTEIDAVFELAREDRAAARARVVLMTSITLEGALRERVDRAKAAQRARIQDALSDGRGSGVHREVDILTKSALLGPTLWAAVGLTVSQTRLTSGSVIRDDFVRSLAVSLKARPSAMFPGADRPIEPGELFA